MNIPRDDVQPIRPHLTLWDSVSIIVGIVIGAGIYETAPLIFSTVRNGWVAMSVWVIGGLLSLIGALCYAELAATYPRSGGDYVYLSRAYGRWVGFLFGWAQLAVILTGSIGMMAYIFADYAATLWKLPSSATFPIAISIVVVLSMINAIGITAGKHTQNVFTAAKIAGLGLIVIAGFLMAPTNTMPALTEMTPEITDFSWSSVGLAMVFVLYTYGGWNDAAFVAAELRNHRRNIPLALVLGTLLITLSYLLVNAAYLTGLGFEGARNSKAIAADLLQWPFGWFGSSMMSLLVMVSALGAINGLIYTGSRLYATLGSEHRIFFWLGHWHPRLNSPVISLVTQASISAGLIAIVGSSTGRSAVSSTLVWLSFDAPVWEGHGGFDTLLRCTAPVFWLFFLLTGIALFILRLKDKNIKRAFAVPLYPVLPLIFCVTSAYMLYRSVIYAGSLTLIGLGLLAAGVPLYTLTQGLPTPKSMEV